MIKHIKPIRSIKTKSDYKRTLAEVNELMDIPKKTHKQKNELDILSNLVWAYEQKNFKIEPPDPIEAIRFRMDQMGISKDIIDKVLNFDNINEKSHKFKGYYYDRDREKFRVQFKYKGKRYVFGRYDRADIAHSVYLIERKKLVMEHEGEGE
jgi:antitoxin component HigA of HigAB toxin-antitoxin module